MKKKTNLGAVLRKLRRFFPLYLMMLPGAIYVIINNYIPMAGLRIAFKQYNYAKGISDSPYIGFKNFEFLFKTKEAWVITRNTLCYNAVFIVLGTMLAIAVAIMLNEVKSIPDRDSDSVFDLHGRRKLSGICFFKHGYRLSQ